MDHRGYPQVLDKYAPALPGDQLDTKIAALEGAMKSRAGYHQLFEVEAPTEESEKYEGALLKGRVSVYTALCYLLMKGHTSANLPTTKKRSLKKKKDAIATLGLQSELPDYLWSAVEEMLAAK